jgi:N-methylhydantoinase A
LGIDVGGTFTDLVAIGADGTMEIQKVSTTPKDPALGLFQAVDIVGGRVASLIHGTTIATNALLERRGARTVLVTTAGFEDLLWLRRQDRAALYDLAQDHPPPLVARDDVVGVVERSGPDGVVTPLSDEAVRQAVAQVKARHPQAVAVALLFAFRYPEHERRLVTALAAALPDVPVIASHDVLPVFREYERFATTAAAAYLHPLVGDYMQRAEQQAAQRSIAGLRVMTSAGGTVTARAAANHAAALPLSGPAGGVVGAQLLGKAVGRTDLLTLDMGGTSADASLVTGGAILHESASIVGGVPIALPAILIESVSAGGGSIAWLDQGGALKVGPRSAGAVPGPACYGRGGDEPTVTDACLALRWLDPEYSLADDVRLDPGRADQALERLAGPLGRDVRWVAGGIIAVATAVMARALKRVSVARGVDPRRLTLVPFGGAGALFGCALAEALGTAGVLIPPHPGVLSALGLAAAAERVDLVASFHQPLVALQPALLDSGYQALEARAHTELPQSEIRRFADCRFAGQGYELTVPVTGSDAVGLDTAFRAAHRTRYGHEDPQAPVEVVNLRIVAQRAGAEPEFGKRTGIGKPTPGWRKIVCRGEEMQARVWALGELPRRITIEGPAILAGPDATALIEPGWAGTVHGSGAVLVERR